jgi:hypothetical protein
VSYCGQTPRGKRWRILKLQNDFSSRPTPRVNHGLRHSDRSPLVGCYLHYSHGRFPGRVRRVIGLSSSSARLGAGCGLVVNFVQIPSANERMLDSIEALAAKLVERRKLIIKCLQCCKGEVAHASVAGRFLPVPGQGSRLCGSSIGAVTNRLS